MLIEKKIKDFIAELASDSPAPGGGSVAALTGTMAASLLGMVSKLTISKQGYEQYIVQVTEIGRKAETHIKALSRLVDEDTEAFNSVIAAYGLPKSTQAEKDKRHQAIEQAYIQATRVPLQVAEKCLDILQLCLEISDKGNMNALSDIGVAACAAWCGLKGAILNVEINTIQIKDTGFTEDAHCRIATMSEKGKEIYKEVLSIIKNKLK